MLAYIDSSVILRILFDESGRMRGFGPYTRIVSSEILRVECLRAIDRLRFAKNASHDMSSRLAQDFHALARNLEVIPVSPQILDRAGQAMPSPMGTLDSMHLSSALLWKNFEDQPVDFLTHDRQLGEAARSVGFNVLGC